MVAVLFIFMVVIMMFRGSVSQIGKDPSLNFLTTGTTFRVASIININKNNYPDRIDECWNQMNPLIECAPENQIEPGTYTIRGMDSNWLEKTDDFEISKEQLKLLMGFIADQTYSQKILISYPNDDEMLVRVETWNNSGEADPQEITLIK